MSEQTFEQMLNESFKTIHTGEAVPWILLRFCILATSLKSRW